MAMPDARRLLLRFSRRLRNRSSSLVDPVIGFARRPSATEAPADDWLCENLRCARRMGGFAHAGQAGKVSAVGGNPRRSGSATAEGRSPPAPFDLMRLPIYQEADERTKMRLVRAWQTPGWHVLVRQMQLRNI